MPTKGPIADSGADDIRGILLVVGAALLWSTGGLGVKALPDDALKIAFYRSAFAAVVLVLVFRPFRIRFSPAFLVATFSYASCLTTFVIATKLTTAANAIFLQYSGIVWVMVASPLVLRERVSRRDLTCAVIALSGMALFFVGRFEGGTLAGNLFGLASGAFFAMLVIALRIERGSGAEAAVTWGNVLAALALLPFVMHDLNLSSRSGLVLGYLGVFQIAIAYILFVKGLERVTATAASLTGMIEPVANPIWVFLIIGERPSPFAIVGGLIVLGAITWRTISRPPSRKRRVAPPD